MRFAAVIVAALALAGCSKSICGQMVDMSDTMKEKTVACTTESASTTTIDEGKCDTAMESCTDQDKDKVQAMLDCWEALPDCVAADYESWSGQYMTCMQNVGNVSTPCATAMAALQ